MSDETTTAPQENAPQEGSSDVVEQQPAAPAEGQAETDLAAELAKWKAMARKNEEAMKRNADKAKAFDEYQESQKSEAEKAQAEIERLRSQVQAQEISLLRSKVAAEKGLEPELAETLTGSTAEEMAEHADRLLAAIRRRFAPKSKPAPEETGAGAQGTSLAQQIAAAEKEGNFALSMALKNRAVVDAARKNL